MPYTALPDMRMPYDNDGTVVYQGTLITGTTSLPSGSTVAAWNSYTRTTGGISGGGASQITTWWFFPEQREVSGLFFDFTGMTSTTLTVQGSNDTTNGIDGTWETATMPGGYPSFTNNFSWRSNIVAVSFTGPKQVLRIVSAPQSGGGGGQLAMCHIYGAKGPGQTPEDIIYLDGTTAYAAFTAPEDFGDAPLGSTTVRTFKVKNTSATKTANTINIQCNDPDFAISTDGVTWVVTINIASLAAGASSNVMYVRNTAPAIGSMLGPRFARIVTTVASYT